MDETLAKAGEVPTKPSRPQSGLVKAAGIAAVLLAFVFLYTYWRVDRVQDNIQAVNRFYVPALKHLNVLSGKWAAYQRSFEQVVAFRKWGGKKKHELGTSKLRLKKMIESNLNELERRLAFSPSESRRDVEATLKRLSEYASREPALLAEIASLVGSKHFNEAAQAYTKARQEHVAITQGLAKLSSKLENDLSEVQLSTEEELRKSQGVMILLFAACLLAAYLAANRVRRWMKPVLEWTAVAQEIALKGTHKGVRFPQIDPKMPAELSLLTREFTRMGTTVLERERTIQQQKDKLENLNLHLKEQNELFRKLGGLNEKILNSMSSGLIVLNGAFVVDQFNERFCELFKLERSKVMGGLAHDVLQAWDHEQVKFWLETEESLSTQRYCLEGRFFEVQVQLLPAQAGRLLLFEDVTELVLSEERLEHARKLVLAGNMSAQVAHEVRNPLNSMSLQLELLQEELEAPEHQALRARVATIVEQVHRLERLTERYLTFRSAGSNPSVPPALKTTQDLHALIEKCLEFFSSDLQAWRIRVELKLAASKHEVLVDSDSFSQVIFNLLRNAIEALAGVNERERVLTIETSNSETGKLSFRITDNGSGISGSVGERLFEPFVTDKAGGHGLGLSLARQICIDHEGDLKLLSSGEGAAFEVSIPFVASPEAVGTA